MVRYLQLLGALLLAAQASQAAISVDESNRLLGGGDSDVSEWIAVSNGYMDKKGEGSGGAGTPALSSAPPAASVISKGTVTDSPPTTASSKVYCFAQPRSHFDDSNKQQFCQRYFFDSSNYKPGGPVIMLDGGESDADGMFTSTNFLNGWAKKLNGIFVVLEHRYYGWSVPVPDFTTDNLRFLTVDEALEDTAEFIRNWVPPAGTMNLTDPSIIRPEKTPWFYWGGSYPGGRAAFMRVKYPELIYGAVSSSGTTFSRENNWQYHNTTVTYGPPECVNAMVESIKVIDELLDMGGDAAIEIKRQFGLEELPQNGDFADRLRRAWDSQSGLTGDFDKFCEVIMAPRAADEKPVVIAGITLPPYLRNYGDKVFNQTQGCRNGYGIKWCYDTTNAAQLSKQTDTTKTWRLWTFQACAQFGNHMAAPPEGVPSVVSKYLSYDFVRNKCKDWFASGQIFSVPEKPDIDAFNKYGGLDIQAERLMFTGGDRDPWRPVTPLADDAPIKRVSTDSNPVLLMSPAAHCADFRSSEGLYGEAQEFEYSYIKKWFDEWTPPSNGNCNNPNGDDRDGDNQDGDNQDGDNQDGDGDNQDGDNQDGDNQNGDGDNQDGDNQDGDNQDGDNQDGDGDNQDSDTQDGDNRDCDNKNGDNQDNGNQDNDSGPTRRLFSRERD